MAVYMQVLAVLRTRHQCQEPSAGSASPPLEHGGQWGPARQVCFRTNGTNGTAPSPVPRASLPVTVYSYLFRASHGVRAVTAFLWPWPALSLLYLPTFCCGQHFSSKPRAPCGLGVHAHGLGHTTVLSPLMTACFRARTWPAPRAKPGSSCVPPGPLPPMEVAFPALSQAQSEHTGPCRVQEPLLPAAPPPAWLGDH